MVSPVAPGSFPQAADPAASQNTKTSRDIAEARRLMLKNQIRGADAIRIANKLSQAEKSSGKGQSVEAERIAREAVELAKDTAGSPLSTAQEEETDPAQANAESAENNGESPLEPPGKTLYNDGSNDSGVSYQSPTPFSPAQAPFAVMQHELSHVRRETSDAILNGQRVMTAVSIHSHIDPATGERHVSGGRTRVIVFPEIKYNPPSGNHFDIEA